MRIYSLTHTQVSNAIGDEIRARGGSIHLKHEVADFTSPTGKSKSFHDGVLVHFKQQQQQQQQQQLPVHAKYVITCGGAYSDRLAVKSGGSEFPKIVPFRGEYLLLKDTKRHLVKGNIYPMPDPRVPFLGVHFTPRINGKMWLGPNAVLAFSREGYEYTDINMRDLWDIVSFAGFWKLALRYASYGAQEYYRGLYFPAQIQQLQRYIPTLRVNDVDKGPSGVRAQAMDRDGNLVDDFVFDSGDDEVKRVLHVRNAPSPAATSSLAIAKLVVDRAVADFAIKA